MTAANTALADFGSKVRDYLNCLNGDISQKAVGKDAAAREELNKAYVGGYNEAANELRGLAACYKTQREIFKSTGGGSKPKPADCSSYIASAANQAPAAAARRSRLSSLWKRPATRSRFLAAAVGFSTWRVTLGRGAARRNRPQRTACIAQSTCVTIRTKCSSAKARSPMRAPTAADSRRRRRSCSCRGAARTCWSRASRRLGIDAETFDAKCTPRAKLPPLDTPANCKYEVVKPITIGDYYPTASQDAGEEGPVVVEFTLSGKAARPTDVRTVASSMYPRLDEAAVKAVGDMVMSSSCGKARYRLKLSFQLQQ